MSSVEKGEIGR